jgi:hypothetical protein
LFVAFYSSAELGCFLALNWPMPARILDLYCEHRCATNGLPTPAGSGLLGALAWHGLDSMAGDEKASMRELISRGPPWDESERQAILSYCASDVAALARLLPAMLPHLLARPKRLGQALLRGRFMAAAARMEHHGVPIDAPMWRRLSHHWGEIKQQLVEAADRDYGAYPNGSFSAARFAAYLAQNRIVWPRLESGALDLKDDTFREQARSHPQIGPLHELRHTLSQLRLSDLAVGSDHRNRVLLSPFRAKTGRNAPSTSRFVFGPSTWLRSLIKPPPGHGLAYCDFVSQEIGIAAALSGDPALIEAYRSGDIYMDFARRAGLVPPGATKATHPAERERCKAAVLGTGYGMGAASLAARIGQSEAHARELLDAHRRTFPRFWQWAEAAVDYGMLYRHLDTVFGWRLHVPDGVNCRSLLNYPAQSNGSEMLRVAACLGTEAGLEIVAPVHDALMILSPLERLDEDVARLRACMRRASMDVLDGFEIATDAKTITWPARYTDQRGRVMWKRITEILERIESAAA